MAAPFRQTPDKQRYLSRNGVGRHDAVYAGPKSHGGRWQTFGVCVALSASCDAPDTMYVAHGSVADYLQAVLIGGTFTSRRRIGHAVAAIMMVRRSSSPATFASGLAACTSSGLGGGHGSGRDRQTSVRSMGAPKHCNAKCRLIYRRAHFG